MRDKMEKVANDILKKADGGLGSYYNEPWDSLVVQVFSGIDASIKNSIQDFIDRFPEETGGARKSYEMGVIVIDALEDQLEEWKRFFAGAEYRGNKPYKEEGL